jgi:hypothetical protein
MLKAGKSALLYTLLKVVGTKASGFVQAGSSPKKHQDTSDAKAAAQHLSNSLGTALNSVRIKSSKWEKKHARMDGMKFCSSGIQKVFKNERIKEWQCTIELQPLSIDKLHLRPDADAQLMEDKSCTAPNFELRWDALWKHPFLMSCKDEEIFSKNRAVLMFQHVLDFLQNLCDTDVLTEVSRNRAMSHTTRCKKKMKLNNCYYFGLEYVAQKKRISPSVYCNSGCRTK